MSDDIFSETVRSSGDLAGVFEYDGETGYFYLCRLEDADDPKIIDSLPVVSGPIDFTENDVSILWDDTQTNVALFIRGTNWAVFDSVSNQKFGGNYKLGGGPAISLDAIFIRSVH